MSRRGTVRRVVLTAAALGLLVAACGSGGEAATTTLDATGGTTAIPTPGLPVDYTGPDEVVTHVSDPTRIVTLSGDMTEIVFALGLGANVVGCDLSSVYPEEAESLPKVGVEFMLMAEAVLAQSPTVVIGDEDARPVEAIAQVREAGVPVVIFPRFMGLEAAAEKIRAVAHVRGVDAAGEDLATGVTERPRAALVYLASSRTMLMLGPNSVMDGLFEAVGAIDVSPTAGADGYAPLSAEALVAGDPEVIVTGERGFNQYAGGMDGFLQLPGVAETTAGRDRRVLVYEDLFLLGLGPRTGQLLAQLFADLHPEAAAGNS
jgi:iron complex transport system substrate-binding protein